MIPSVAALVFLIPQIAIYGIALFQEDGDITSGSFAENIIFYGALVVEFVLTIWTFVLSIIGVSVVQEFSIGSALLNLIMPVLVIGVPLLLLFLLMYSA